MARSREVFRTHATAAGIRLPMVDAPHGWGH